MRFEISRASLAFSDVQPTPEAFQVEGGHKEDWYIEIADLPALLTLIELEGDLVIDEKRIWIYDDYME